ncbi:MAG: substrate-binding domain-containing protein, partial [Xanthomonadales bacterium]|nr:substrate-binding domain-containing protein [Xanthomonadales bacterium]
VSLRQLNDIYYGRITNWNALGGPNHPIHLYAVASPLDGVEYSLRQYLFGRGNQPVIAPRLYINTKQLEDAVAIDPYALGATTMSSVMGNSKLHMLAVEHVFPTPETIADGSYPLIIPLYLAVSANGTQHAAVEDFLAFLHTKKAQQTMRAHHVLPYDAASPLALNHAEHLAAIVEASHFPRNGPVAAPGATYASKAAIAPTSQLTTAAYQRMLEARKLKAVKTDASKPVSARSTTTQPQ